MQMMNTGKRFVKTLVVALTLGLSAGVAASEVYFVDGYHGGIYGHYPVKWKTRFIVDQLQRNPDWKIGLEIEPETWDTVQVRTPEAYRDLAALLKSGRIEFTNPTYGQPYCYNISGESLIRQFAYGIEKLKQHFPEAVFTTYAVEEPCFTSCLPAVLKGFGFKYASLKCPNTCWGGYMAPYGGQLVNWIGPDGTSLLTVPRYGCEQLENNSVWQTTAWGNSPEYLAACREAGIDNPVGMCYQDAGWRNGPWLKMNHPSGSVYTLWTDYIEKHTPGATSDNYHLSQDDVLVNLMWGSQVMQRIGRGVRAAENKMVMAEKLAAIAMLEGAGAPLPDQGAMDEAWRQLMLAQHHDSWIVPYNGLWHFGTWADAIRQWTDHACGVADSEMMRMACGITPGNRMMIKVFNTQGVSREEIVSVPFPYEWDGCEVVLTDHTGRIIKASKHIDSKDKVKRLVFKATVPPMGYATYRISRVACEKGNAMAATAPGGAAGREVVMENDKVRLTLDLGKGGTVKSLILKTENGREFAPSAGDYAMGEMRGFFYDEGRFRSSAESPVRVVSHTVIPGLESLTMEGEIAGHPFTQTLTLAAGSTRIDYDLDIDWNGNPGIGEYRERHWNHDRRGFCDDRYKLCVLFPAAFPTEKLYKDAPFDVCLSRNEDTFFNTWSGIKHNVILNWVDAAAASGDAGIGIISDHTTSYVHGKDYPVGLTLQYSGQGLWGRDYKIDRPTHVRFAIVPHTGNEGAEAMAPEAESYNEPLLAFVCGGNGEPSTGSLCATDNPGYRVSAAIRNGDRVTLRLHNCHGAGNAASVTLGLPGASVAETDLAGNTTAEVKTVEHKEGIGFTTEMPRNGFRTYSIKTSQKS
jgi:alpha-mannosidase